MPRPPARRRELLALHRRHAGRVRAVLYWLGAELEVLDAAVLRTFLLAARGDSDEVSRADLGRLAWRVASRTTTLPSAHPSRRHARPGRVVAPRLPPAADALARFLADHAAATLARALFVLSEFTGVTPEALAAETQGIASRTDRRRDRHPDDPDAATSSSVPDELTATLRAALVELRLAFAADPEVVRHGGPRSVLEASLAPFTDDDAWQHQHAAAFARELAPGRPDPAELLRRPTTIVLLGTLAIATLLLLRPGPHPPLRVVAVREAPHSVPVPSLRIFPPVPTALPLPPGPPRKVVRVRSRGAANNPSIHAERERVARTRDPGAIIVELEMLGAARKSLTSNPRQSLAYTDQHASEYPDSQLADQRAEVRVRALCALKRSSEARSEAARRSTSPRVQTALREACR